MYKNSSRLERGQQQRQQQQIHHAKSAGTKARKGEKGEQKGNKRILYYSGGKTVDEE